MTDGRLGRLLRWIQPLFLLAAAGFIGYFLYSQWPELRAYPWRLHGAWFAAACALLLVTWAVEILIWRNLLHALGGFLPVFHTVRIWFLSAIVRYIPGNVWQPLSITLLCNRHNIRPETTIASVALYQIITLLGTLPIVAVYIYLKAGAELAAVLGNVPWWLPTGLLLGPLALFLVNPLWLMHILNWLLRKVRRAELTGSLTRGGLLTIFLVAVAHWLLWGATFAALTFSLGDYTFVDIRRLAPHLIAIYPLAYAIGFISLITPSGFGVREGALMILLAPYLPVAVITVIALAMRLWTMGGELLFAGAAVALERRGPALTLQSVHAAQPAPISRFDSQPAPPETESDPSLSRKPS